MKVGFIDKGTMVFINDEGYTVKFYGEMLMDGFGVDAEDTECFDPQKNLLTNRALCDKLIEEAKAYAKASQYPLDFDS